VPQRRRRQPRRHRQHRRRRLRAGLAPAAAPARPAPAPRASVRPVDGRWRCGSRRPAPTSSPQSSRSQPRPIPYEPSTAVALAGTGTLPGESRSARQSFPITPLVGATKLRHRPREQRGQRAAPCLAAGAVRPHRRVHVIAGHPADGHAAVCPSGDRSRPGRELPGGAAVPSGTHRPCSSPGFTVTGDPPSTRGRWGSGARASPPRPSFERTVRPRLRQHPRHHVGQRDLDILNFNRSPRHDPGLDCVDSAAVPAQLRQRSMHLRCRRVLVLHPQRAVVHADDLQRRRSRPGDWRSSPCRATIPTTRRCITSPPGTGYPGARRSARGARDPIVSFDVSRRCGRGPALIVSLI